MKKVWTHKEINTLTDREKDLILKNIFNAVLDYETHRDIGEFITEYLTEKGYVFQEEIED